MNYSKNLVALSTLIRQRFSAWCAGEQAISNPSKARSVVGQSLQNLQPALQGGVAGGVADAKMAVPPAKSAAGNDEQVVLDRLGHKIAAGPPGGARKQVECATRFGQIKAVLESRQHASALAAVVGHLLGNVRIQSGYPGMLHHAGRAHKRPLLQFDHLLDELARAMAEPQPPAGHAVSLAETVHHQHILLKLSGAAKCLVV